PLGRDLEPGARRFGFGDAPAVPPLDRTTGRPPPTATGRGSDFRQSANLPRHLGHRPGGALWDRLAPIPGARGVRWGRRPPAAALLPCLAGPRPGMPERSRGSAAAAGFTRRINRRQHLSGCPAPGTAYLQRSLDP